MAVSAESRALTAKLRLIPQSDMNHTALAAVHRIEPKRLRRALHLLGGSIGAEAKFGDPQHPEIVRVEGKARMVVIRDPERLHRDVLESQEEFGLIRQKQFDVRPFKFHHDLGIFNLRVSGISRFDLIFDVEIRVVQDHVEKIFDARAYRVNGIFGFVQSSLPDAWILCWRAADVSWRHGLVEEPLLCDTHKISSEPV